MFTRAITRKPGPNAAQGLTTSNIGTPNFENLIRQHKAYIETLTNLGLEVIVLEAEPAYPDAYFVEDVAVVTPEVAVITIPGALSRQGEQETVEPILAQYRPTKRIEPPGTVEGGDVLLVDKHCFIGISERTNATGAAQLGCFLEEHGYSWQPIPVGAGLHLKSSVNDLGQDTLILTQTLAGHDAFKRFRRVIVDENETYAANILLINDQLIMPAGYPLIKAELLDLGREIIELDVSEVCKMDGGLTCMSLRLS
jgi:dimethylargininase